MTYDLSDQVKRVMEQSAITLDDLTMMLVRAAKVTHPEGNRRYHSWLLQVEGKKVLRLRKFDMTDYSQGCRSIEEECEACDGEGCAECGWVGKVKRLA